MTTYDTVGSVRDLVALTREIEREEHLSWPAAIHRALSLAPELACDIDENVRFQPTEVNTRGES